MLPNCSLWINVARTDVSFIMHTIPHLVKMCNFPFVERVIAVDTAPLSGDKPFRPDLGSLEQLRDCCNRLLDLGVIDNIVDIDYSESYRRKVYTKHFKTRLKHTHTYHGFPILGYICTEKAKGDYLLHFDSDMFLYQESGYSWIEEGIKLLQEYPEIMAVAPLCGPPTKTGELYQQKKGPYERDARGFYKFKHFSNRVYLIDIKRFERLLPLKALWYFPRYKFINYFPQRAKTILYYITGKGYLENWEDMVSYRLKRSPYFRVNMDCPCAWTLHPLVRGQEFIKALPKIIERIEKGQYSPEQAGKYDIILNHWL